MQIGAFMRRFGLAAYWVIFAAYTLLMAQSPGLMMHPERWTYPWKDVFVIWALLGVCVAVLYLILRPVTYQRSWGRLLIALVYAALLAWLGMMTVATDLPGHACVPALFAVATMALVLVIGIVQLGLALFGWVRNHASQQGENK